MEPAPPTALKMVQPDLILQFLIVALDPPPNLGQADEVGERDAGGQRREPELGRHGFSRRPLDRQPFLGAGFHPLLLTMRGAESAARQTRAHSPPGALPPPPRLR